MPAARNYLLDYLLVEDDHNDAALVVMASFQLTGARVSVVRDGQEAIQYLSGEHAYADRRHNPLPQVILLDLHMPGMDGYDLISWLRREAPPPISLIPVVVMTASDNGQDLVRAYSLGANTCIQKPRQWNDFLNCMKTLHSYWGTHAKLPSLTRPVRNTPVPNPQLVPVKKLDFD